MAECRLGFGLITGGHNAELCAWTLFHEVSKETLAHCVCHHALKRPSASEDVDIIKSENDIRFKYAVLTMSRGTGFLSRREKCDHLTSLFNFAGCIYLHSYLRQQYERDK